MGPPYPHGPRALWVSLACERLPPPSLRVALPTKWLSAAHPAPTPTRRPGSPRTPRSGTRPPGSSPPSPLPWWRCRTCCPPLPRCARRRGRGAGRGCACVCVVACVCACMCGRVGGGVPLCVRRRKRRGRLLGLAFAAEASRDGLRRSCICALPLLAPPARHQRRASIRVGCAPTGRPRLLPLCCVVPQGLKLLLAGLTLTSLVAKLAYSYDLGAWTFLEVGFREFMGSTAHSVCLAARPAAIHLPMFASGVMQAHMRARHSPPKPVLPARPRLFRDASARWPMHR